MLCNYKYKFSVTYKFHSVVTDGKEALETEKF